MNAMTSSVASLVEGIKVAFLTSIYGLALALVYTYNMRSSYDSLIAALDDFLDKFHANVMPSAEMEAKNLMISFQQTQADSINRMADQFSDQLADSFEKVITPAFRKMNQSLDILVTSMTKGQEEMVKGILDEFLKQPDAQQLENDLMVRYAASVRNGYQATSDAMQEETNAYNAAHKTWVEGVLQMKKANGQPI